MHMHCNNIKSIMNHILLTGNKCKMVMIQCFYPKKTEIQNIL